MKIHIYWLSDTQTIPQQIAKTSHKSDYNTSFCTLKLSIHFTVSVASPLILLYPIFQLPKKLSKIQKISQTSPTKHLSQKPQIPSTQNERPQRQPTTHHKIPGQKQKRSASQQLLNISYSPAFPHLFSYLFFSQPYLHFSRRCLT